MAVNLDDFILYDKEEFKVFRRENGTKPFIILGRHPHRSTPLAYYFLSNLHFELEYGRPQPHEDYIGILVNSKGEPIMESNIGKLHTYKDGTQEQFGTLLAMDSNGNYVLEVKSANGSLIMSVPEAELVMPYTVDVSYGSGNNYSFKAKKGSVKVGDFVILEKKGGSSSGYTDFSVVRVQAVDTKSSKATKELKGIVLQGTKI